MATTEVASPSVPRGLDAAAVEARRQAHGPNELPAPARTRTWRRLVRELREPMALLLVAAAAVSGLLLGETVDAVAILVIVGLNATIALAQEGRARRALEALRVYDADEATVVRDGRVQRVPAAALVPDDVVVVTAGDRVPADLELVTADALQADESLLTGESMPVDKEAGGRCGPDVAPADRTGGLLRATLVVRGTGTGTVIATGARTAVGAIAASLRDDRRQPTPLQLQLAALTRWLGAAALAVASATFLLIVAIGGSGSVEDAFLPAVALAVAAVPEGLAAVTTVALALGVARMARRGAVVRRLPAVETLGATDVLVIDKTGTVTENRMDVVRVHLGDGTSCRPTALPESSAPLVHAVLALCNDATLDPPTGDPMEQGLLRALPLGVTERLRSGSPRRAAAPFTTERMRMSVLHELGGVPMLLVKGAPESVIPRCAGLGAATFEPFDRARRTAVMAEIADAAASGERMLALAVRALDGDVEGELDTYEDELRLVGVVALRDPPRASARGSVAAARAAGIRLVMATGDHAKTALAIASEIGLAARHRTRVIDGAAIRRGGLGDDPSEVSVYARVEPGQKLELVRRLRSAGHVVAMTGDGVNDAPALRHADIGVALGASGSDVAREAADLVITDDDLATIVAAVREGRGIYDNLRKVVDYLVSSNLAEIAVVVGGLIAFPEIGLPLLPLQLLWINLVTDGPPALALGVDPVADDVMRRPPRAAGAAILSWRHLGGLAARGAVLGAGALGALAVAVVGLEAGVDEARTVAFSALVVAQVAFAFVVRRPARGARPGPNPWLARSAVAALLLQALVVLVPPLQVVFGTATPSPTLWLVILAGGILGPAVLAVATPGPAGRDANRG